MYAIGICPFQWKVADINKHTVSLKYVHYRHASLCPICRKWALNELEASKSGTIFLGLPEESRLGVLIPHFFGAVFQSHRTHFKPHSPIPSPHLPPPCYLDILSARCQRQWRHWGICSDQIMFHKRSHLWRMTTAMATAHRQQLWSNDLLQFSSYLNFFEIPLVDGRQSAALC